MGRPVRRALGLMSGTSMDGIDAALIETDGDRHVRVLDTAVHAYDAATRALLRAAMEEALRLDAPRATPVIAEAERVLTVQHAALVNAMIGAAPRPDVIGFHGQTVAHRPAQRWTWQIGEGARLAQMTRATVVSDLRSADVAAGGEGAPLLPAYHWALAQALEGPVAILNLGGVGNISWVGGAQEDLIAFDTGPGNALIDDWVRAVTGATHDSGGAMAAGGTVHDDVLTAMLDLPWFDAPPPKSLDRNDFSAAACRGLSAVDGAATLTAFTAETVRIALSHLPARPARLLVTGGGRHNATLMRLIGERTGVPVAPVEAVGWRGDTMEAEGFAYLAVRALDDLPLSWPGTTGVPRPISGGRIDRP